MKRYLLSAATFMLAIVASGVTYMQVKMADDQIVKYEVDDVEQIDYEIDTTTSTWKMRTKTRDGKEEKYNVDDVVEVNYVLLDTLTSLDGVSVSGKINGYTYVDLGLESGLLWATYNVGATKPSEYGNYYAWSETAPKSVYNFDNLRYYDSSTDELTKYCTGYAYGRLDNTEILESIDDAANVNWGNGWRMPYASEQKEMINGCTWEWISNFNGSGIAGRLGTSKYNGNTIFFPAAGGYEGIGASMQDQYGFYWSCNLYDANCLTAKLFMFTSENIWAYQNRYRAIGYSVRAVVK